jgi:hypothetical protein
MDEALRPSALRQRLEEGRAGQAKDAIPSRLEALRGSVSDEQEAVLLEVMDFLVGCCSPHARID